jgi:hypothetical protein
MRVCDCGSLFDLLCLVGEIDDDEANIVDHAPLLLSWRVLHQKLESHASFLCCVHCSLEIKPTERIRLHEAQI